MSLLGSASLLACGTASVDAPLESPASHDVARDPAAPCAECASEVEESGPPMEGAEQTAGGEVAAMLDHGQVQSVVLGRYSSISGCHTIEYSGAVSRDGKVTLAWVIESDGSVSEARVVDSTLRSRDFEECVLTVIRGLQFPPSREGMEVGGWQIAFKDR